MKNEMLTIVYRHRALTLEIALGGIQSVLAQFKLPSDQFALYGETVRLHDVLDLLRKKDKPTFVLQGHGFSFALSSINNYSIDFLEIRQPAEICDSWDIWIKEFCTNVDFVMGWVVDSEYDFWQNATDPLQYSSKKRSYKGLPMKSNGRPFPLEKKIIDTSNNPGRRILKNGYVEAIGATMWLGEPFWHLTGAARQKVTQSNFVATTKLSEMVVMIQSDDECFKTSLGEKGKIQNQLRTLLFPKSN